MEGEQQEENEGRPGVEVQSPGPGGWARELGQGSHRHWLAGKLGARWLVAQSQRVCGPTVLCGEPWPVLAYHPGQLTHLGKGRRRRRGLCSGGCRLRRRLGSLCFCRKKSWAGLTFRQEGNSPRWRRRQPHKLSRGPIPPPGRAQGPPLSIPHLSLPRLAVTRCEFQGGEGAPGERQKAGDSVAGPGTDTGAEATRPAHPAPPLGSPKDLGLFLCLKRGIPVPRVLRKSPDTQPTSSYPPPTSHHPICFHLDSMASPQGREKPTPSLWAGSHWDAKWGLRDLPTDEQPSSALNLETHFPILSLSDSPAVKQDNESCFASLL